MVRIELNTFFRLLSVLAVLSLGSVGAAATPQEEIPGTGQAPAQSEKKDEKKDERKKGLKLKPERKVEFTTDEGTWLSLDVSPDGRTIAFELLGDLYSLPIEGGEAKRLPVSDSEHKDGDTMAFDSQPRFSPDGKWLAFLSDRDGSENLWMAKADGTEPKKLSKDSSEREIMSPNWTPDSQYVLVSKNVAPTHEVWMYHIQGGSGVQVTRARPTPTTPAAQRHNALGVVATRDGKHLYFARSTGGRQYNREGLGHWQIVRKDRLTGDEDLLTNEPGSAVRPAISPDGTKLVYISRQDAKSGIRLMDLKTGEARWLKYPVPQLDDQESDSTRDLYPNYAFLPDGREIVIAYDGKIHRLNIDSGADRPIPFTAKVSQELGPRLHFPSRVEQGPVRSRILQTPAESPDGKRLAFSTMMRLYLKDLSAPAGAVRQVLSGPGREFYPAWSPDGQWLAYVTWQNTGGHIWKIRGDGSGAPQQLTRVPAYYSDLVWSPDGERIVAFRTSRQNKTQTINDFGFFPLYDVVWIPSNGGETTVILPVRGAGSPQFTRDPNRLYLYTGAGLISLRFDGTDRITHIRVTVPPPAGADQPAAAGDVRISPDGKWLLAYSGNQVYAVTVPVVGGDAPTVNLRTPSVPVKKITDIGADSFDWADDGKVITWTTASTYFRQKFSTVEFEPPKKEEGPDAKKDDAKKEEAKKEEPKKKNPNIEEIEIAIEFPRAKPSGTVVLRGANVITMKGDEVLKDADIVVTDNRIASIGARGKGAVPAGAKVVDVKGHTIIPGFVDTHAHWRERRRGAMDPQFWSLLAALAYGVTAGLDVQPGAPDLFAYQDMVDAGLMPGPRAYNTGQGVFGGFVPGFGFNSLDEVKDVLSRYTKHYRTSHIKAYLSGPRKQRQWVIEASKELKLMPTTEGGLDLKMDLTHVIDGMRGNEHNFPIVPLYKDVTELTAKSGLFYTPTLVVTYGGPWGENVFYETTEVHDDPKLGRFVPHNWMDVNTRRRRWFRPDEYTYPRVAESAAKMIRTGGKVCVGSHGQIQGIGFHWELWLMSSGMTNHEALRAATQCGAEALGLAQDIGSVEAGKLADLVILTKDPLADIKNTNTIKYVMKNGELYEGDTLNQVWPVQKPLEPLWWWDQKPRN